MANNDDADWEWMMSQAALDAPPPPVEETQPELTHPIQQSEQVTPLRQVLQVDLVSGDEQPTPASLNTRGRQKRKADGEGAEEERSTPKKKKKSKNKTHTEGIILDPGFVKRSSAEYEADPIMASVNVILNMAEVAKSKYEAAEFERALAIRRMDEAESKLLKNEEELKDLKTLRATLKKAKSHETSLTKEKEGLEEKKTELSNRITELEGQISQLNEDISSLKAQISDLEKSLEEARNSAAQPADSSDRVAELEKLLAEEKLKSARAIKTAISQRQAGFASAIQQAMVVHPSLQSLDTVFSVDHKVEGETIVRVDRQTKDKTVIFTHSGI